MGSAEWHAICDKAKAEAKEGRNLFESLCTLGETVRKKTFLKKIGEFRIRLKITSSKTISSKKTLMVL